MLGRQVSWADPFCQVLGVTNNLQSDASSAKFPRKCGQSEVKDIYGPREIVYIVFVPDKFVGTTVPPKDMKRFWGTDPLYED